MLHLQTLMKEREKAIPGGTEVQCDPEGFPRAPAPSQTASDQMTRARQLQKLRFRGCCWIYHKSTRLQRESGRRRDVVLNAYVETECPPDGSMCPPWGGARGDAGLEKAARSSFPPTTPFCRLAERGSRHRPSRSLSDCAGSGRQAATHTPNSRPMM